MGIKGKAIVVIGAGLIGYLVGRGDGKDIQAYNNALDRIATLEADNQHLSVAMVNMQRQTAASTAALNKRASELDEMQAKAKETNRKLTDASKSNSEWAGERVPSSIAHVLRTPSDK